MAGPGGLPPEGVPGGGDDEYRSTVFDESFVRAARLQEFSARERLVDHEHPVRSLPPRPLRGVPWQGVVLVLLLVIAFGTAIHMNLNGSSPPSNAPRREPLSSTVVPLEPRGKVPGGEPDRLFARSPAAEFHVGAAGVTLPPVRSTPHFTETQVLAALTTAKEYLVESSLNPEVLDGGTARPVRIMIDPTQHPQFDRSLERPAADGRHAATGWLVRFDPRRAGPTGDGVRVRGTMAVREAGSDVLEVRTDHVFVYAVRPAAGGGAASLFTVRRELVLSFDRGNLRDQQVVVERATVRAGPMSCGARSHEALSPLTAGQTAGDDRPAATDPYDRHGGNTPLCGTLSPSSQPSP
ncbi:hypothetical protein [Streptomyces megasporus]|uniref:SCO2583 family membrane protein n=1 Tax=Streptomyces megasporus TaxID=44060 RepID=UPI0004E18D41|nr:hypothetical protein [Streptomyces megasporus]